MGLPVEHKWTSSPEERAETAKNLIQSNIATIFQFGAFVYFDGRGFLPNVNDQTVPSDLLNSFNAGRITVCRPKDAHMPGLSRLYIFPPNSDARLTYKKRKKVKEIALIHGLDDDGNPVTSELLFDSGPMGALISLAASTLKKMGISILEYPPREMVTGFLVSIADAQSGGHGDIETRVQKMKEEMMETVDEVEKFINGNGH